MRRIILLVAVLLLVVPHAIAEEFHADWSKWDPAPMTIVYPEQESLNNPPFIHWQPQEGATSFRISISGARKYGPWTTTHNFYTPTGVMDPGPYGVEIEALGEDGKVIGEPAFKQFVLQEATTKYVPDMNRISREAGTSMFARPDVIEQVKQSETSQEYFQRMLQAMEKPEPDYFKDPKEPRRYPNQKWDWQTWKTNNDLAFIFERRILTNTLAYKMTGETKYFDEAKRLVLIITKWDPRGATSVWENDHSAQALLHSMSLFYDTAKGDLSEQEREEVRQSIAARCADMYDFLNPFVTKDTAGGTMNDPNNNHPWFAASALGLGAIALMNEEPRAEEWLAFTTQLFWGVFLPHGDRDGGWHEGLDYWSYTLWFVFQLSDALKATTDIDFYKNSWLQNTGFFKIYTHPPVGALVPFGDSHQRRADDFDKLVMMRIASETNDPAAWKYVEMIDKEIENLGYLPYATLWSLRSDNSTTEVPEMPFAQHFRDIGWVVSNSDPFNAEDQVLFAFRSGKFYGRSFGHTQADLNHFIIAAGGERLIWDAGFYDGYLSPHHRNYSRQSQAHNTILVNGTGQVVHTAGLDGKITEYELDGENLTVVGDASKSLIYGGRLVRFIRTIEYKDRSQFTISDDVFARELSQFSFLLHSNYPIVYNPSDRTLTITGDNYKVLGTFATDAPVTATIRDSFEFPPNKEEYLKQKQYELELKTVQKIESWTPKMTLKLEKIAK